MSYNGKLMALARQQLEQQREKNAEETLRRRAEAYRKNPRIKEIDSELQTAMLRLMNATLRKDGEGKREVEELVRLGDELRLQREKLLADAGYPSDYLDDVVSCTLCSDTGHDQKGNTCACVIKLYEAEQSRRLTELMQGGDSNFFDFKLSYYDAAVDPARGISPRQCMELIKETCREYAASFGKASPNLLFRGGTGLGKTMLSGCIAKTVSANGSSVYYETASAAFSAFEEQKFSRDQLLQEEAAEKVKRILSCDLLILDDLGTEMTTTFTQSAFYTILNSRLAAGKKSIVITNLSAAETAQRYMPQIVSRLEGEYETLLFMGRDVRAIMKENKFAR